jgi:hypothetical protein
MRFTVYGVDPSGLCSTFSRCKHVLRHSDLLVLRVPCHLFTRLLAVHHCAKLLLDTFTVWDHASRTLVALHVSR